jgi:hypothetical protein
LPIAILVPIRIRIENPQIFPSWESPYDSAKRENALAETGEHGERDDAVSGPGREQVRNAPASHICIQ